MAWEITGNNGTSAVQHFLGTADDQAFSIRVNSKRALRIEPGTTANLIGGHEGNEVAAGVTGATISGGGNDGSPNRIEAAFGVIVGGLGNQVSGERATVGGGSGNQTSGLAATVPGGEGNAAGGDFSFAAGRRAKANHAGTFVWSDANDSDFVSTADNQFLIQATGGVGIGTPTPNQVLTIQSTSDTHLNVRANDGAQELLLGAESTGGIVATATNHALHLRAGGANPMLSIQPNGKVGIGTVSPSQALEVNGVVKAKDFIKGTTRLVSSQWNDNAGGINFTRGNVGIGTPNPVVKLHILGGTDAETSNQGGFLVLGNINLGNIAMDDNEILARNNGQKSTLHFQANGGDVWVHSKQSGSDFIIKDNGHVGVGTSNPSTFIHVRGGATCNGARWIDSSSMAYKKNVTALSLDEALATLAGLNAVTFAYKEMPDEKRCVGFIAEDVPDLVASQDRKGLSAMDIVGILTRVVQHQQEEIAVLKAERVNALSNLDKI